MEPISLPERIAAHYHELPGAQRKIADFLLARPDETAFMTVEQLAEASGASPATVTRFATQIGFAGFPALQQAARQEVRDRLTPPRRLQRHPPGDIFARSFEADMRALEFARHANSRQALSQGVEMVLAARRIFVLGLRSSYPLAVHTHGVLTQALGNTTLIGSAGGYVAEEMALIAPADLLLIISFPRYVRMVLETAAHAHEKGIPVLALTDSPQSPAARLSKLVLVSPFEGASFFNTPTASLAVANALLSGVAAARQAETAARLGAVEESIARLHWLQQ